MALLQLVIIGLGLRLGAAQTGELEVRAWIIRHSLMPVDKQAMVLCGMVQEGMSRKKVDAIFGGRPEGLVSFGPILCPTHFYARYGVTIGFGPDMRVIRDRIIRPGEDEKKRGEE
jgi:hypothetical protein